MMQWIRPKSCLQIPWYAGEFRIEMRRENSANKAKAENPKSEQSWQPSESSMPDREFQLEDNALMDLIDPFSSFLQDQVVETNFSHCDLGPPLLSSGVGLPMMFSTTNSDTSRSIVTSDPIDKGKMESPNSLSMSLSTAASSVLSQLADLNTDGWDLHSMYEAGEKNASGLGEKGSMDLLESHLQLNKLGKTDNKDNTQHPSESNEKPLVHLAAEKGRDGILKILLKRGLYVDEMDSSGRTALHLAVMNRHEDVLNLLLSCRANVNHKDASGRTPLHLAILTGNEAVAKLLLGNGADVNAIDGLNWTPLHVAVDVGFEAGLRLLLLHGANLSMKVGGKQDR
ncbi:hypothetical protein BOTNAR_0519g00010 [Botryotinia narcissicola]|uniref:Uncharacterized protein n=1 Tax=Botryotinia narcissicola TaxID=278944 RepID=A0A4Z1HRN9_9HELO|nr:hypothetical protein BOTNAR_0519g00010 [Botryotinia narcissicola]